MSVIATFELSVIATFELFDALMYLVWTLLRVIFFLRSLYYGPSLKTDFPWCPLLYDGAPYKSGIVLMLA